LVDCSANAPIDFLEAVSFGLAVDEAEYARIRAAFDARWRAGEFKRSTLAESIAIYKTAKWKALRKVVKPIPPRLVAKAIREHGDRGLAAFGCCCGLGVAIRGSGSCRGSCAPSRTAPVW